jgi:uncharacterized protein (DUF362 family)/ferredoxin|tara:strand:- start:9614 stop:10852 length:1239 start_codon:yes stop_codon:yes gene_type:complete
MNSDFSVLECNSITDIRRRITKVLQDRIDMFPKSKDALILLKPNLNSDMNTLTGNTTDLRVIVSVIGFLQKEGYKNIVIADGTSSGFYHNHINVISRLKVERVAEKLGVKTLDLNNAPHIDIDFGGGFKAKIAKICFDSDFFINLPKLKMHFEVRMSACLKNLIGCVQGLEKQKVHDDLAANILKLNQKIKPNLNIVDGLIVMEGTGPSAGRPAYLGSVVIGFNPYIVDGVCAKLMGWNWRSVPYLRIAQDTGLVTAEQSHIIDDFQPSLNREFLRPHKNLLVTIAYHPMLRKYITNLRLSRFGDYIVSQTSISKILVKSGLRQDTFIEEDEKIQEIYVDSNCEKSGVCADYCPMELNLPDDLGSNDSCVECLYCFFVCPKKAIKFKSQPGFLTAQIKKYEAARKVANSAYS